MKHNMRLTHGGHQQDTADNKNGLVYWSAAEEDVQTAILAAGEIFADHDCLDIRRYMDGAEKGQAIIGIAGLILQQRRFYIEGGTKSIIEEMI